MPKEKNVPSPKQIWRIPIKFAEWGSISKDSIDFIYSQAELLLQETLDTAKGIGLKADRIITILSPLTAALIIYVLNNVCSIGEFLPLTALLSVAVLILSIGFSYRNFQNYKIRVGGDYPKEMLTIENLKKIPDEKQQYLNLVINQCEILQDRIDKNDIDNIRRQKRNTAALKILVFGLIPCPVLGYFFSHMIL
jgi:hypothetical protein